jgi:diacylglycerol kinase (ATP)
MHSMRIIANPTADRGRIRRKMAKLRDQLTTRSEARGVDLEWVDTQRSLHATELASQSQAFDVVVACGGDGTVHEVVNGLMSLPADLRPALGVLPAGSGNDFAFGSGIPAASDASVDRLFDGLEIIVDVGWIEDNLGRREWWSNTAGIGFDGLVTIESARIKASRLRFLNGFPMYLAAVLKTFAKHHQAMPVELQIGDEKRSLRTLMVTVGNGPREGGGFMTTPDSNMSDGVFEYLMLGDLSRLRTLALLPMVLNGTQTNSSHLEMGKCMSLGLTSEIPLAVHLDGEIFAEPHNNVRNIRIGMEKGAIRLVR